MSNRTIVFLNGHALRQSVHFIEMCHFIMTKSTNIYQLIDFLPHPESVFSLLHTSVFPHEELCMPGKCITGTFFLQLYLLFQC